MRRQVSQRLKRANRTVDKLLRFSKMRLSQMQDVGGCRAVVSTLDDTMRLRDRILETWAHEVKLVDDYVAHPKPSGYRAVHIVILRHKHLIELQLRTKLQHAWATAVESLDSERPSRGRRRFAAGYIAARASQRRLACRSGP